MTLRLVLPFALRRPPVPPIRRRKIEEPKPLSEETKRKLILVAIARTKLWSN